MDTAALVGPGSAPPRARRGWIIVLLVALAAVAGSILLRAGAVLPYPAFQGACERLRASGLPITPRDWFCHPMPWTMRAGYAGASLLVAIGFSVTCAILAATGRRASAFAPLVAAPFANYEGILYPERWLAAGTWPSNPDVRILIGLLVIAAPAVAVMLAHRGPRTFPDRPTPGAQVASGLACLAGVTATVYVARGIDARHLGELGGDVGIGTLVPAAIAITLFGALLGTDRRWWPWSLVPAALLLSMGPSAAMIVSPAGLRDWSRFGAVAPLFAIGLIASAWQPLANRIGGEHEGASDQAARSSVRSIEPERLRPTAVLNAVAVGVLVMSVIAFRADPLPVQLSAHLPTYLGARNLVNDLRTKSDLRRAIDAAAAYAEAHGTLTGFDAAAGRSIDPSLGWTTRLPTGSTEGDGTVPQIAVELAGPHVARVVASSPSGTIYCLERSGAVVTYGDATGGDTETRLSLAVDRCGATPWTAAAVRPFPIATMCDGADPASGYLICRMVQALMTNTMSGRSTG